MEIGKDQLPWMYERMRLIREFELHLHDDFAAGNIPGFVHLYAGEEAVAVGVCANLADEDFLTSTHRSHGHCLDTDTILGSIRKTGRLVVVDEDNPRCSMATDIAALAAAEAMESLTAPVKLVTPPHTPVPFNSSLEDAYIPTPQRVAAAVRETLT